MPVGKSATVRANSIMCPCAGLRHEAQSVGRDMFATADLSPRPRAWIGACGSATAASWGIGPGCSTRRTPGRGPEHDRGDTWRVVGALLARCWRLVDAVDGVILWLVTMLAARRLARRKIQAGSRRYGAAPAKLTKMLMFHVKHWPVKPSAVAIPRREDREILPTTGLQLAQQPRQLALLGLGQPGRDAALEGAHALARGQERRLG